MRGIAAVTLALALVAGTLGCGGGTAARDGGSGDAGADALAAGDGAAGDGAAGDGAAGDGAARDGGSPASVCAPLAAPTGTIVDVSPDHANELRSIVGAAATGTTIRLADGTYSLGNDNLRLDFTTPGVTLRSASGNRDAVILDGGYVTGEVITITASNVTIADLTIANAYNHAVHVTGSADADISGVRLYNLHVVDPGQQGIKVNPSTQLHYADQGIIECSLVELTGVGRPRVRDDCYTGGIDAHAARGWVVRFNTVQGFWCASGLAEHGIHFWRTSRDTLVERNRVLDCARGIGFGLGSSGTGSDRVYSDNPYPGSGYLGHIDGVIRNNFVFARVAGHDSGISLEQARGTQVLHNSVVSIEAPFSSIEWRWDNTEVWIVNNLTSHDLVPRDGATAHLAGNIPNVNPVVFVDAVAGDLHLDPATAAIAMGAGVAVDPGLCDDDFDGDPRTAPRDVGADEL